MLDFIVGEILFGIIDGFFWLFGKAVEHWRIALPILVVFIIWLISVVDIVNL